MKDRHGTPFCDGGLLRETAEKSIRWLEALPFRRVGPWASAEELRKSLGGSLNEEGMNPSEVLSFFSQEAEPGLTGSPGPRYFGFVTGGALPASLAADWLSSAWDQNAVLAVSSPAASAAEDIVSEWVLDLLGLPPESSVGFVTGCQMANFTCLAAARHEVLRRSGWDVEKDGLQGAPRVTVIAGEEAHATLLVALRMLGLGTGNVISVPVDGQGRMVPEKAEEALKTASGPVILCLQAGNVNTGSFDPCAEIIPAAREKGAWVHVDGAFGLWGRVLPSLDHHTRGIELADSWATDAHKWLNVPYDSGIAIVRNGAAHRASMALNAPYYIAGEGEVRDPSQWVPESSRRARAFPLYCGLKSLGRKGVLEMVEQNCRQARLMASLLSDDPMVTILNDVVLNQVLVRFSCPGSDSDAFTRMVTAAVQEEGTCWAGGSVWKGMAAMRISVSNWATSDDDITRSADAIRSVLGKAAKR
ncbi:MAG: aspartate aminotransferase family protein [Synergistales bacterium]|jgi:glutamate/tyrosine decarboxylase-like PLP-dependent enzyme|nr:aminotransferase class V-fold PLP-dependent enzyme [Synergistaceae bacterium]MDD4021844.1 aminotransferase class V-fold PLP-dependent enzyme [Synergistaceae bacterium]NCC56123.1 aspartate aminotransferase family protein [Synergistales bacterium]